MSDLDSLGTPTQSQTHFKNGEFPRCDADSEATAHSLSSTDTLEQWCEGKIAPDNRNIEINIYSWDRAYALVNRYASEIIHNSKWYPRNKEELIIMPSPPYLLVLRVLVFYKPKLRSILRDESSKVRDLS